MSKKRKTKKETIPKTENASNISQELIIKEFMLGQWTENARLAVDKMNNLNKILALLILFNFVIIVVTMYNWIFPQRGFVLDYSAAPINFLGINAPLVIHASISILAPIVLYFRYISYASAYKYSVLHVIEFGGKGSARPLIFIMPLWKILFKDNDEYNSIGKHILTLIYICPSLLSHLTLLASYRNSDIIKLIVICVIYTTIIIFELFFFPNYIHWIAMLKSEALLAASPNAKLVYEGVVSEGALKGRYIKQYELDINSTNKEKKHVVFSDARLRGKGVKMYG